MNPNFPCKDCTHVFEEHVECYIPCSCGGDCGGNDSWCQGSDNCNCYEFVPDNLGYLEKLSKKKK
jgi:hypothetical protein